MARNDNLNIRLNAQANLTNIDGIKKDLEKVMSSISLDKGVEGSFNKIIKRMEVLEKSFENISKKDVFNSKDIETVTKKTQELQSIVKEIDSVMDSISLDTIIKSSEQYKKLMKDINEETKKLKDNFKKSTGLDYDKEIKGIKNLESNIKELKRAKEELQKTGVDTEYRRLLDEQNSKLDEQRQKLQNLKILQSEIVAYQNQMAKSKGFDNYESLQKMATIRTNKSDYIKKGLTEAEAKEAQRLTAEYTKLEEQLKRIENYKNQASKTRGIKKLSEQLGIDATTINDIDKVIQKMKELTDVTAKANVNQNNTFKTQLTEQYNQLVRTKTAAKEYVDEIERGANARVAMNALTNTRTTTGLGNEIASISALLGAANTTDANDSLLVQAQQTNTNAINSLDDQIGKMSSLFNNLTSTTKALVGLESQQKEFLNSSANSLKNIDQDTTDIITNISSSNRQNISDNYSEIQKKLIRQSEGDIQSLVNQNPMFKPLSNGKPYGTLGMFQDDIETYLQKAYSNIDENGLVNMNIFSDLDKIGFAKDIEEIKKSFSEQLPMFEEQTRQLEEEIRVREKSIQNTKERIAQENKLIFEKTKQGQSPRENIETANGLQQQLGWDETRLEELRGEYSATIPIIQHYKELESSLYPILQDNNEQRIKVADAIRESTPLQNLWIQLQDAQKRKDEEEAAALKAKIIAMAQNRQEQANDNAATEELIRLKDEARQRVDNMTQSLLRQSQQLQQSSTISKTFNQTFGQIGRTVGTYISLNYIVNQIFSTIRRGISTVKEMDDSITQIGVVTNRTSQEVWAGFETYNAQAKRLKTTTTQLLQATKLYYQQGLNTAEVNEMVEATAIAAALGEVEMAEAADTLTAIMNGYEIAATKAMEVTDKISAVGADSAADFGELSSAIEKVASSAATAGIDLDHLLGYLGKMIEVTREAPTNIGSAMKTIVARMAELKEDPTKALEDGTDVNKVQTALRTVGIELFNTEGQMRELDDVIDELGGKWNSLSRNSQAYIATTIAGNRQQSRFLALMNDYDRTMELVTSSTDSAGRSSQQFRNYSTGLESSLNRVKAEAEDFYASLSNGNGAIKGAYDLFADFLSLLNKLGPALTFAGAGITTFFAKLSKNISQVKKERSMKLIADNIANQIENDKPGSTSLISSSQIFGGISNGKTKIGRKFGEKNITSFIFNKANKKQISELNSLIESYNNGLLKLKDSATGVVGISQQQAIAINQIAENTGRGIEQSAGIYIQQQKQNLGTKALTASMWANVAAQAAMTLGISLIIGLAVKAISHFSDLNANLRQTTQNLAETAQASSDEANSMKTLVTKYEKLSKKINLTNDEKEELKTTTDELIKQYPDLVEGINSEGEAYLKTNEAIRENLKLKQKKALQDEQAFLNSKNALANKNNGQAVKQGWWESFWGTYKDTNTSDTYGETSTANMQSFQDAIGKIGYFEAFKSGAKWNTVDPYSASIQLGKGEVSIEAYEKAMEEWKGIDETVYAKMQEVARTYRNFQESEKDEMVNNYKQIIANDVEITALNKNLTDEQSQLVKSMSGNLTGDFLEYYKDKAGTAKEYEQWIKENKNEFSDTLSEILTRAATGSNSDKVKKAYDEYLKAQSEGLTEKEIEEKRKQYFDLIRESAKTNDEKELVNQLEQNQSLGLQDVLNNSITQAMSALKVDENDANYDQIKQSLTNIFSNIKGDLRGKVLSSINEVMNNEDLFGGNELKRTNFAQNMVKALSAITSDENIGPLFQEELNKLDINNAVDVQAFHTKWNASLMEFAEKVGMNEEEKKLFVEKLIPKPGSILKDVTDAIKNDMINATTINEQDISEIFAGDYNLSNALEDGFGLGEGNIVGDKFLVLTDTIIDKMDEANDKLKEHIEALKIAAIEEAHGATEEIVKAKDEIEKIKLNAKNQNRDLTITEQTTIDSKQKLIKEQEKILEKSSKEIENAKKLNTQLDEQIRKRQLLSKQGFFNDYNSGVNQQIQSLKDLASAYDDIKQGELSQLDIIEMIANNTDLLTAVYVNERGELALNKNALEELAKAKIKQAIIDGQTKISQLENLKAQIEADQIYTDERRADMEAQVKQDEEIRKEVGQTTEDTQKELQKQASQWDSWVNSLQNNVLPAFGQFLSKMLGGISRFKTKANNILGKVSRYIQSIADGVNGQARNVDDMMYINEDTYKKELNATGSALNKDGALVINLDHNRDDSADDTYIDITPGAQSNSVVDKFGGYEDDGTGISGTEYADRIQKQIDEIKAVNAALQKMYDNGTILESITAMGGKDNKKDEFKAYMEYFEKFYNYMKQIQNLEAKINRLREKRNIIDANKNYYIKDLQKENELLAQQAVLYNDYIRAQRAYLSDLRGQISSAYGDLAYFTDEGLLQLKVSQVWISSESQEERIKEFQRLMEEYESQYETMQENETKLYEIQNTQLQNITTMYDKVLKRLDDVRENLEFIQSISEHKITMAYGNLETLDLLNDKLLTSIDLWSNAQNVVSQLEGDMKIINDQVKSSNLGQFLQWDKDLNQYRITDAFYDDLTRQEWESMGANWAEVTTWVTKTAKESEEVATKWREAKENLMSAEETLKSIVDDRLSKINDLLGSWVGEFTNLFGIIDRYLGNMGTKNDLFGTTPQRLQEQYEATAAAAALAKANVQQLTEMQRKALEEITSKYGEYVSIIGDSAYINETAIKESTTLSESEKAILLEKIATYKNITSALEESEDKLLDYLADLKQFEEDKRQAIIDIKTELHDQLIAQDQEELDDLQKKYDEMERLDTEYYNSLRQKIDDARSARDLNQTKIQTDQMRAQIAVMQRDNTSQYNKQLIELQKQLNEQLQQQADDAVNRELERIQREQQERQEDRDLQIQQMENLITFKDENGLYWQEAQALWEAGRQETEGFLATRYEQEDIAEELKAQKLEERNEQIDQAFAEYSGIEFSKMDTSNAETGRINQQLEKFFDSNNQVKIADGNITGKIGNLNIDVNKQLNGVDGRLSGINGNISGVSESLNKNIDGLNTSIVDIGNSRETLWSWLRNIYNEIYSGNHNTTSTGIINNGGSGGSSSSGNGSYSGGGSSSGSGNYNNGGGDGVARVGDRVTFNSGWYYYDSNGTRPAGHQYQGKQVYITNTAPGRAKPYHISTGPRLGNGDLGWLTLEQLRGYKTGGYVDFTGPTMVHGSKSKPEAFLNAKQTALFENLRDSLIKQNKVKTSDKDTYEETVQIENVNINVQEVADTDSIDKIIGNVKQSIYKDATNGNNMKLRRR